MIINQYGNYLWGILSQMANNKMGECEALTHYYYSCYYYYYYYFLPSVIMIASDITWTLTQITTG